MEVSVYLLGAIITLINVIDRQASDIPKLNAVSHFITAEAVYHRIKMNQMPPLETQQTIDIESKKKICHHITSSSLFKIIGESEVNMDEIYDELKHSYPKIHNRLYKESTELLSTSASLEQKVVYLNPNKLVQVFTSKVNSVPEWVFVCLANRHTWWMNEIVEYVISEEYNVSDVTDTYIAGRFIFKQPHFSLYNQLRLTALAEEAAKVLSDSDNNVEKLYLARRNGYEPEENRFQDPICTLSSYQRHRVCTLIFNSDYFGGRLMFAPISKYYDEEDCQKKIIMFNQEDTKKKAAEKQYEEWMIRCMPTEDGVMKEYFISRAYKPTDVFVYYKDVHNDNLFLENLSTNIRFY